MHSRTPVGLLSPGIIKDKSDAGEITRISKKRVQTGNFSDYVPLLIEGFSYSCFLSQEEVGGIDRIKTPYNHVKTEISASKKHFLFISCSAVVHGSHTKIDIPMLLGQVLK